MQATASMIMTEGGGRDVVEFDGCQWLSVEGLIVRWRRRDQCELNSKLKDQNLKPTILHDDTAVNSKMECTEKKNCDGSDWLGQDNLTLFIFLLFRGLQVYKTNAIQTTTELENLTE